MNHGFHPQGRPQLGKQPYLLLHLLHGCKSSNFLPFKALFVWFHAGCTLYQLSRCTSSLVLHNEGMGIIVPRQKISE
jgi:hypothetical protein